MSGDGVELDQREGTQPPRGGPSVVARIFFGKSNVARYSVEFDRVWGVPKPPCVGPSFVARMFYGSRI